jgi:hypothetical protein
VDVQGETVTMQDVEHVEDVPGAVYEADHLGDVHGVAGRAYASRSLNFGRWSGWRRLEVTGSSSSNVTGSSIPASSKTRFCRAVDSRAVDSRL